MSNQDVMFTTSNTVDNTVINMYGDIIVGIKTIKVMGIKSKIGNIWN